MLRKLAIAAVLTALTAPAFAATPAVDAREANQRQRIAQGVRTGELTRPETRRLAAGEVRLRRAERRAKCDGVVTRAERIRLHRRADRMSARIWRQKHDPQTRR